jgi:phenylacetate-CoA ligase
MTERQVMLIRDQPECHGDAQLAIADEFGARAWRPTSLRIGIFGAEPWTDGMRAEIQRRMGLDAIDIYGLSEVMGPGVAQECIETKDGLTVWEDHPRDHRPCGAAAEARRANSFSPR